jgi:fatty acid desaturase
MAISAVACALDDPKLADDVRELATLSRFRLIFALGRQWAVIAAAVVVAAYFGSPWAYVPVIFVIASRQHALGIIMHDATHYRLFKNRTANDLVSDWFCAFPTGLSTQGYREEHLEHHRHTGSTDDPYFVMFQGDTVWSWPKSRFQAARVLLADVSGWNTLRSMRMQLPWTALGQWLRHRRDSLGPRCLRDLISYAVFWGVTATLLTLCGGWKLFLLCWFVPGMTFYQLFVRLRWISEHPFDQTVAAGYETRHVEGTWLERLTIAPLNINYHIAHHLFPGVPFYRLPAVHERLLQCPAYREQADRYRDYLGENESVRAELVTTGTV